MRSASMLLLSALLCSTPVLAHVIAAPEASKPEGDTLFNSPREHHRLFFSLTREQSWNGPKTLELRIRVDGEPYLTETLALSGIPPGKPSTFELLAQMQTVLEKLHDLAERPDRVRVQVLLDGRKLRELSFQELLLANLDPQRRAHLRQAKSSLHVYAADVLPKPEGAPGLKSITANGLDPQCVSACDSQFTACANSQCGGVYCEECAADHDACIASCPCYDPKASYQQQTQSQTQETVGNTCLYLPSYQHSHWHYVVKYQTVTTTWQRTDYCDGSYSLVPISTSYSTPVYCPQFTNFDCSPSYGTYAGCHY